MRTTLSAVAIAILSSSCDAPSAPPVVLASPTEPVAVSDAADSAAAASRAAGEDTFGPVRTPTGSRLDADGDGRVTLQTDGVLIQRYIAGFSGDTLVKGAVGPGCRRCTADEISAYLSTL
jgi:hypothetical protein